MSRRPRVRFATPSDSEAKRSDVDREGGFVTPSDSEAKRSGLGHEGAS
jgi:hypothetical protein